MELVEYVHGQLKAFQKGIDTIELYQDNQRFIYVSDIEQLKTLLEEKTGLAFHYQVARGCNYFYHFWLEDNTPIEPLTF